MHRTIKEGIYRNLQPSEQVETDEAYAPLTFYMGYLRCSVGGTLLVSSDSSYP